MRKFIARQPILFPTIYGGFIGLVASVFFSQALNWLPIIGGMLAGLSLGLLFDLAMRHQAAEERHISNFVKTLQPELKPLPDPLTSLFLYNTLHNISALLLFDVEKANAIVQKLANLVRSINELRRNESTSIGEEFKAAGLYLEIEKERLGDRLAIVREFDQDFFEAPFPSLTLYPLVDNGVRYGAEMHVEPVTVSIVCRREGNDLIIEVSDKIIGEEKEHDSTVEENRAAVFASAKQRLLGFYGSSIKVRRERLLPAGEQVTIKIPLNNAKIGRYSADRDLPPGLSRS